MPKRKVTPGISVSIPTIGPDKTSSIKRNVIKSPIISSTHFSGVVSKRNSSLGPKAMKSERKVSESNLNPFSATTDSEWEASGSKSSFGLTATDLERKALELVKYFLIADQKKIPIKQVDINNHVLKEHKTHFSDIIEKARELLRDVFGADLLELEDKMKGRYILVKRNHDGELDDIICSEDETIKLGFLFTILAIIYMSGDLISDKELWNVLHKLGVDPDHRHETFGDVKKLVTVEFVKQGYLEYVKQTGRDPPFSYELHWGQRANKELRKKDILVHVSKIYGMEPTEWTSLWKDCLAEENVIDSQMETSALK